MSGRDLRLLPYQIVFGVASVALAGIVAVLGELRDELDFSDAGIGLIVTVGFLASFVTQVVFAPFADRGHGRTMAVAGIAVASASLFLMAIADTVVVWATARGALGFAAGLLLPGMRRAASVLDPARAGENLGKLVVGEIVGFTIGPLLAAVLVEVGDVRTPFWVMAIGMAAFVPFVLRLPEDEGQRTTKVQQSFDLLKRRRLQGALLLIFGYFLLLGTFEAIVPLMFQDRGGGALETGIAFTVFGIPIAIVATFAGRLADRHGGARVASIAMTVAATSAMFYGIVPGIWPVVAVMTLGGLADGLGFTAGQLAVSRSVPEARQAGALGLMGAAEVLGAGAAALPAAAIYGSAGAGPAWAIASAASLVVLLAGMVRIRGTQPVNASGADLDWTPLDRHPSPAVD